MKHSTIARLVTALLCLALILSLSACGGKTKSDTADVSGAKGMLSGSKGGSVSPAPEADQEKAEASVELLRRSMAEFDLQACAVAYLGHREKGDTASLPDWLQANCSGLTNELPFILSIPSDRVLGGSYGDLFCFVPRDESSSFAVNRVKWMPGRSSGLPENVEVLYRSEKAQPILVFCHCEEYLDKPDIEIHVIAENGVDVTWYPQLDEWGNIVLPADRDGNAAMLDFTIFGDTTGLDYPGDWNDPPDDGWWLPPTNEGLADTTWSCEGWIMELRRGSGDPDYFGVAELRQRSGGGQTYTGAWRMNGDCLELMLSAGVGTSTGGCFPVLIDQSGDNLVIQQSRDGISPPFFDDGVTTAGMSLVYD